ncbi:hypothetical protein ACJIZ3_005741 [Penstemon smallii]|uniref:Uncharacterized protein n=1 Tax=Penstemon smallii TaxID=265156 RepID=A0ABD3S5X1_9LAMI
MSIPSLKQLQNSKPKQSSCLSIHLAASTSAVLITFNGSIIPAFIISTYSPVPISAWAETFSCIISMIRIIRFQQLANNYSTLDSSIRCNCIDRCTSSKPVDNLSNSFDAYSSATPPPGTIPSSTAAFVAFKASVTLSFFSPTSASLAPPI